MSLALSPLAQAKAFYARLRSAGNHQKLVLGVAMRQLLMIAVGVLRRDQPFQAAWAEKAGRERAQKAQERRAAAAT